MREAIATEIQKFRNLQKELVSARKSQVHFVAEDAFWVQDQSEDLVAGQPSLGKITKKVGITYGALVHGNEWGGLLAINHLLQALVLGTIKPSVPVGFFLGNPAAALQAKRFLERDLNRSFSVQPQSTSVTTTSAPTTLEGLRALEIEKLLGISHFFVDFHQTIQPSQSSFFIFSYSAAALRMARSLNPYLPVITHWGAPFSKEGCCSDEYTTKQGGLGITIELGGISPTHDPIQTALGFQVACSALAYCTQALRPDLNLTLPALPPESYQGPLFTWGFSMPWPKAGYVELVKGLTNFSPVQKNQILGTVNGHNLRAPLSGKIMFPKYLSKDEQSHQASRPTELFRILKDCRLEDLPDARSGAAGH